MFAAVVAAVRYHRLISQFWLKYHDCNCRLIQNAFKLSGASTVLFSSIHPLRVNISKSSQCQFAKNFDYRITSGGMPFSGQPGRTFGGWIRFREEQQPLTTATILALVDAWPPAVLPHLDSPAPASSLTWTIEFPDIPLQSFSSHDWFQYEAFIEHAENGYGHSRAGLWSEKGELLAISRQTFTVFA